MFRRVEGGAYSCVIEWSALIEEFILVDIKKLFKELINILK